MSGASDHRSSSFTWAILLFELPATHISFKRVDGGPTESVPYFYTALVAT